METKDIKILEEYFKTLNPEQQKDVISVMGNVLLSMKINTNEDFKNEAFDVLFSKYPELQDLMERFL